MDVFDWAGRLSGASAIRWFVPKSEREASGWFKLLGAGIATTQIDSER